MKIEGFFPKLLIKNLKREKNINGIFSYFGTVFFADLSGFTSISEYFASFGREGSEELTKVLNDFFSRFYESLKKYDGDILRFAGDAVTTFFEGRSSYEKASKFSEELLKIMVSFENYKTKFGNINLRLKGGISSGSCVLVILGKEKKDYVFTGEAIRWAVEAEKGAKPNEILSSKKEEIEIEEKNFEDRVLNKDIFNYFLSPYLKEVIEKKEEEIINGHRKVVVIFIRLGKGLSFEKFILETIEEVIDLVEKYGGYLNKIDFSDKGNLLMVLFGAPLSIGEEIERALEFLNDLKKISREKNVSIKIGVNYENVYCGIVGSKERFEYTVMGDGVNTAARLMEISPENEAIFSENFYEKISNKYNFETLPPVKLKGKERQVNIGILKGKKGERQEIPFIIGRKKEIEELEIFLNKKNIDKPNIAFIKGPSGIGKSYLINYFFEKNNLAEKVIYGRCSYISSTTPYGILKDLILETFSKFKINFNKEYILNVLKKEAFEIYNYSNIILNFFGFEEKTVDVPAELYKNLLWKMVLVLIKEILKENKIYWLIDNSHFLDGETKEYISYILDFLEVGKFYIFILGRDDINIKNLDLFLELKPFNYLEAKEFGLNYLKVKDLPEKATSKAFDVSGGNPLFLQEILKLMLKSGYLQRDEEFQEVMTIDETLKLELPDTFENIAISQLDLLSLDVKQKVMELSIFGENIPTVILSYLKIEEKFLKELVNQNIFFGYNPYKEQYFFLKQSYQYAIYNSIGFSYKRKIHKKIGNILEKIYKDDEKYLNLIAYHFSSARVLKAIPYLLKILENSKKTFSLYESYNTLKDIIEILRLNKRDYKKYLIDAANLGLSIGKLEESEKLLLEEEKNFKGKFKAKANYILGEILRIKGSFKEAEERLINSLKFSKKKEDKFKSKFLLSKFYSFLGYYRQAKKLYKKIIKMKEFENFVEYHISKVNLAYIYYEEKNDLKYAIGVFEEEMKWFKKNNYVGEYLTTLSNLAGLLLNQGIYKKALKYFINCYNKVLNYGFYKPDVILNILSNISLLLLFLGKFEEGKENILKAISYGKKFNSPIISKAYFYLSFHYILNGEYSKALENLEIGIDKAKYLNFPYEEGLQFLMYLSYILGNVEFFKENLISYKKIIEEENIQSLKPSLVNYEAELAVISGRGFEFIDKAKENLKFCKKNNIFEEEFRALRFLYLVEKKQKYLKEMEEIFKNFDYFIYCLEFLIFKYEMEPSKENKVKLLKNLKKCPDNVLKLKAYKILFKFEKNEKYLRKEKELYEKLIKNLPDGWHINRES